MTKTTLFTVLCLALSGCSTTLASSNKTGKEYTCTPANASERGPWIAAPEKGETLTVK